MIDRRSRPASSSVAPIREELAQGSCLVRLRGHRLACVSAIAELDEDRVVEQAYAVARKQPFRTHSGTPYLALELVDSIGRIEARVWSDVKLRDCPPRSVEA
jgi:hypothetical protein